MFLHVWSLETSGQNGQNMVIFGLYEQFVNIPVNPVSSFYPYEPINASTKHLSVQRRL